MVKPSFQFLIGLIVTGIHSHSVWIPEGNFAWEVANKCYMVLKTEIPPKAISPDVQNLDRAKMAAYGRESAELRLSSLDCIRENIQTTDSDSNLAEMLKPSLLSGFQLEESFFLSEWRILLTDNRPYPLTPSEIGLAKQWLESRNEIKQEIFSLTLEYLSEKNHISKRERYLDLLTGYYGSMLRERDKFLLSLSVESYASYTEALKLRKEKSE
ncbi:hypothetical protein EHQ92_13885 [Leptospira biflexa]|uniref:hypothetical protein n=1 Tax=Leptospira biflexa TaxID=172 RepID=UPI00109139DD|nr:hypothetical protein [Leptospira biflexa]TGM44041.1 hypothetical protein EHQ92_13885 [Leptospira biflexa]TGM45019.1 hypothetical protein EHQ88_15985 [Leptospira biflexa]